MRTHGPVPLIAALPLILLMAQETRPLAGVSDPSKAEEEDAYLEERRSMVSGQIAARGVNDARVLGAMLAVPRHLFVPESLRAEAYNDYPLPIGEDQTISQPYIVALMTELLDLGKGDRVLEVGTGSGYQAAILAAMECEVFSIEIIGNLCRLARRNLKSAGIAGVKVIHGDGYYGLPDDAPFDGIIVTAAPDHIPPRLVEQLKPKGRMVIPVGPQSGVQHLILITKDKKGRTKQKRVIPVRFVPLTGDH